MANPKNELQEIFQKLGLSLPDYKKLEQSGPAHCLVFKVQVTVRWHGQELVERAEGPSKKAAEKEAAKIMLAKVKELLHSGPRGGRRLSPAPSLPAMQPVTPSYGCSAAEVDTPSMTPSCDKIELGSKTSATWTSSGATAMDSSVADNSPSSKNRLQELLQKRRWPMPEYPQISRKLSASTNKPEFTVKCVVRNSSGEVYAEEYGSGSTKKEAEKDAATNVLPKVEKIFREGLSSWSSPQLQRSADLLRRGSASPPPEITDPDLDSDIQQYLSGYVPSFQTKIGEGLQESTRPWLCLATVNASCSFPVTAQGMGDTESAAKRDAACNLLSNLNALGYTFGQGNWTALHAQPNIAS